MWRRVAAALSDTMQESQDGVTVSQDARHCDPEDEAAERDSAIIHFLIDTRHFPTVTSQEAADVDTIMMLLITDSDNSKLYLC